MKILKFFINLLNKKKTSYEKSTLEQVLNLFNNNHRIWLIITLFIFHIYQNPTKDPNLFDCIYKKKSFLSNFFGCQSKNWKSSKISFGNIISCIIPLNFFFISFNQKTNAIKILKEHGNRNIFVFIWIAFSAFFFFILLFLIINSW